MKLVPITGSTVEIFLEQKHIVIPPGGLEVSEAIGQQILREKPGEFVKLTNQKKAGGE